MTECVKCEVAPVCEINGEKLCEMHAEQRIDFMQREAPPIAYTKRVPMSPQTGSKSSGTPRHY